MGIIIIYPTVFIIVTVTCTIDIIIVNKDRSIILSWIFPDKKGATTAKILVTKGTIM